MAYKFCWSMVDPHLARLRGREWNSISFPGAGLRLQYSASNFWTCPVECRGGEGCWNHPKSKAARRGRVVLEEKLPSDPSWTQLRRASEKLMAASRDRHHVFIEGFRRVGKTIHLETGS